MNSLTPGHRLKSACWLAIVAAAACAEALAADVIQLRPGYWEFLSYIPDQTTPQRTFQCLTPEELENMRFFVTSDAECTTLQGGKQTRTTYEIDQSCQFGEDRVTFHYLLEAPDPIHITSTVSMVFEGETQTARGTGRWLQESCDASRSELPIS